MEIRKIKIEEINPASYNPRVDLRPGDLEYEKLKTSIHTFGSVEPIVWNKRTGNLVGGHQRLKISIEDGIKEVDVSVVDLSLEQEKVLNLALNKIQGAWDQDKLAVLLNELTHIPEFDLELTGFEAPEVSTILDNYFEAREDNFDFAGAVDSIVTPVTQKGDLIQLGEHRILCGDSSDINDLKRLMQNEKASLVISDPPYLAHYVPGNRPIKDKKYKKSAATMIQNDNLSQEVYEKWLRKVFSNMAQFLEGSASIYVWNGFRQFGPMIDMLIELGFHVSNVITWVKPSICISFSDYNFQSEFLIYGWYKGGKPHRWFGSANASNIWEENRDNVNSLIHQNQKPIELAQRALRNSSIKSDLVLDSFLGSGSTLIAAESLGRRCYGIEIEPKYCDAIVRRYINFIGANKVSEEIKERYLQKEITK